jgi:type I restriction enzyme S subunit
MSARGKTRALGELCRLLNGRAFKPSEWGSEGLPIVRIQNLNDPRKPFNFFKGQVSENHLIDTGAILLSWSGTPGTSFGCFRWTRGPSVVNQHIFKVIIDETLIDGDYFIEAVNSRLEEMIGKAHGGVGLRHITKSKLEAIQLPLPTITEQRRIVADLKECFDRVMEIEQLRLDTSEREALIGSLIEAEFQSVKGVTVRLEDVCGITSDLVDPQQPRFAKCLHVGGANIESSTGRLLNLKTAQDEKLISGKFPFDGSMVLYNKIRPYLKKVARPDFDGICSADMYPLSPNPERLRRDYLFFLLLSRNFTEYAIEGSNRAGMPKVNRQHLFGYRFVLPALAEQERIASELDIALTAIEGMRTEFRAASEDQGRLRDAILHKVFAGEL